MTGERDLRPDELSRIFDDAITPWVQARLAQADPGPATLVLVGAQPGAGKTRVVSRASQDTGRAVPVVGDDLRRFHPDYVRLMREEPLRMPEVTALAAGAWARMSSDYLRERQASVDFETTFRQPDAVVATAKEFRDAGYRVEVRALAVPEAVSRLGVLSRYAEQVRDQGVGRWTPQAFHDVAAEQMPKSLERVIAEGHVDRVLVVDRAGRAVYTADIEATAASSPGARDGAEARTAVDAGRRIETLDSEAARTWLGTFERDANFVLDRADLGSDVVATIDDLRRDGDRIARLAHEQGSPSLTAAESNLAVLGVRTSAARELLERNEQQLKAGATGEPFRAEQLGQSRNRITNTQLHSELQTQLSTNLGRNTSTKLQANPQQLLDSARSRTEQPTLDHGR